MTIESKNFKPINLVYYPYLDPFSKDPNKKVFLRVIV